MRLVWNSNTLALRLPLALGAALLPLALVLVLFTLFLPPSSLPLTQLPHAGLFCVAVSRALD
jgi:hypothetical protein